MVTVNSVVTLCGEPASLNQASYNPTMPVTGDTITARSDYCMPTPEYTSDFRTFPVRVVTTFKRSSDLESSAVEREARSVRPGEAVTGRSRVRAPVQ
jgi:hypothetical protein